MLIQRLFASRKRPFVPGRDRKDRLESDLSGTKFSIELPPFSLGIASQAENHIPSVNVFDEDAYTDQTNLRDYRHGAPAYLHFVNRRFGFWGPIWRSTYLGWIGFASAIGHAKDMPSDMSCFNPEHFERVILRSLYFSEGPGGIHEEVRVSPMNWKVLNFDESDWVFCESRLVGDADIPQNPLLAGKDAIFYTPLDTHHFLMINFHYSVYSPTLYAVQIMDALASEIMGSVNLQLSSQANELKIDAKKRWSDSSYSPSREPEKWRAHWFDSDSNRTKIIELGTPPPSWEI